MPARKGLRVGTLSQVRQLFTQKRERQKLISWNPDRYGFDKDTYTAVVVVTREGKREVYPARSPDEAQRIYRTL